MRSLTIIVPAFNEEARLADTVRAVTAAARHLDRYEIVIVNDGSADGTGRVADRLTAENDVIRVVHQPSNRGVGAAYLAGLSRAAHPFVTIVPGDNAFTGEALETLFQSVGSAPLIVSYRANVGVRTPIRRVLSVLCTWLIRVITGRAIRDAQSLFVFPVEIARTIPVQPGYGYHIESLGRLLILGVPYKEIPATLNPSPDASSRVLQPRVLWTYGVTTIRLALWRLGIGRRRLSLLVLPGQAAVKPDGPLSNIGIADSKSGRGNPTP